jgi:hypothetical protein
VWVVAEVSHRVVEDQRNGALELLLSTPLAFRDIVRGQGMALLRQFGRPVLALCVLEIVVFQSTYSLRVILPVEIILIADLFTLFRVALPLSLGARSINEVLLKSFLWVLILPWAVYLVAWPIWEWAWRHLFLVRRWHPEFQDRLYLWFFVGLVIDAVLVLRWASPQWLDQFLHGGSRREGGPASPLQKWLPRRLKTTA